MEPMEPATKSPLVREVVKSVLWDGSYTNRPKASPLDPHGTTFTESTFVAVGAVVGKSAYTPRSHGGRMVKVRRISPIAYSASLRKLHLRPLL